MIPAAADPRWIKILKGEIKHDFKAVAAGLMISRLTRELQHVGSAKALENYAEEMRQFFLKYENVFQDDIKAIFG